MKLPQDIMYQLSKAEALKVILRALHYFLQHYCAIRENERQTNQTGDPKGLGTPQPQTYFTKVTMHTHGGPTRNKPLRRDWDPPPPTPLYRLGNPPPTII